MGGAHSLIELVSEKVLEIEPPDIKNSVSQVLIPEENWDIGSPGALLSPAFSNAQVSTPTHTQSSFSGNHGQYGPQRNSSDPNGRQFAVVPQSWFWPMDPENPIGMPQQPQAHASQSPSAQPYQQ